MKLVLASQSPRRRDLLAQAGFSFEVRVADVAEIRQAGETASDYVLRLSKEKASAVSAEPDEVILAADTIVVVEERILEKPGDPDEARSMLRSLSGRGHQVMTGVCLRSQHQVDQFVETTAVWFAPLSEQEIEWYIATSEPYDKAGGYATQGLAGRFIERIEGDYQNVVGLPLHRVYQALRSRL